MPCCQGVLKNGKQIAVKTLSAESKQGVQEFRTEVNTLSDVKHPNLVELLGCCIQGTKRILVYDYVENSSLDRVLLGKFNWKFSRKLEFRTLNSGRWRYNFFSFAGSTKTNLKLDWEKRSAICVGIAKGLAFLHEELVPHIVHRDIKASNILLDEEFNPKIGDFGLAKLFPDNITHITTRIAGTTYVIFQLSSYFLFVVCHCTILAWV